MDSSPLIKAHDHARAAAAATHTADSTVAINEHTLAAGEFSAAAKSTNSVEALRTLKLLEQHHQRLSELIKFSIEHPLPTHGADKEPSETGEKETAGTHVGDAAVKDAKSEQAVLSAASKAASPVAPVSQQRRYPPSRELSSSIASNLASARGIRSARMRGQPLTPSISNDLAPGNLEAARRDGTRSKMQHMLDQTGKPSWVPPPHGMQSRPEPQLSAVEEDKAEETAASPPADEGYSRFYSAFGSIINKISAPLAFAGLPLVAEEPTAQPSPVPEPAPHKRNRIKSPQLSADEPDLSKIFSRATVRAITGGSGNDSFYVVPTSGHTVSYRDILSFDQKERRRMAASMHGDEELIEGLDEDDFVDARESQAPLSPGLPRKRAVRSKTEKELYNAIEELKIENASLKDMLDKVTKRLHAFEASAQSSRLALAESMRLVRPGSPLSSSGGAGGAQLSDEALKKRNKELEEELEMAAKHIETLEKDYNRVQKTVVKYRDKWDKLKAGAKARREGKDAQGSLVEAAEGSRSPA
ncbi:hypothetical protein UCRPA7_1365 [Phaeoacremonium minimum UCRPA7]|uniref:Uncharacterized protein n=1 Tax=Phaeoacremonium minimum (strain UCR-PA7) TaxID=1286976 RepID=R8BUR3_PHAM7|nr:hypothetical protein UCRPA7_1365 [Phaeoacremonium minimum UCRPA7]EOO03111.1 hypothetical protein UCRPA7_1365 [Phaeoacremonium minimum UCRPA7]